MKANSNTKKPVRRRRLDELFSADRVDKLMKYLLIEQADKLTKQAIQLRKDAEETAEKLEQVADQISGVADTVSHIYYAGIDEAAQFEAHVKNGGREGTE